MLKSTASFRVATHDDAALAAAIDSVAEPHRPLTAEELLEKWINTEKGSTVRRFVVVEAGRGVGWISLVKPNEAAGGETYLNLLIAEADKHLIPEAVAFGETQAREMGAPVLICEMTEDRVEAVGWLRNSGWTEERRQRFWRLDLTANADRIRVLGEEARRNLAAHDVAISTVAEQGGEPFLRRLHTVGQAASADVPSSIEYVAEPYEEWVVWMRAPSVLPERIWVAVIGDEPVGYSYLAYHPSLVETGFTGVLRAHRGKGLARSLKLETLVQAIDLGVVAVETDNDSENAPILHLNEAIGYAEIPGKIEFHHKLT